jgi:hypothetical protein
VIRLIRFPLLAAAVGALTIGIWGGLERIGWQLPAQHGEPIALHGPLMVFGFLGTLVSLERAVALRRWWGYLAPLLTLGGVALLLAGDGRAGRTALLAAGLVLVALFMLILCAHVTGATLTLTLAALLWCGGVSFWLAGRDLVEVVPWWTGFLVVTILGERLELAALSRLTTTGRFTFAVQTVLLIVGLVSGGRRGAQLLGVALVAFSLWLLRFDISRHTVKRPGLPRFVAVSLLIGYGWLLLGGVLWLRYGLDVAGPSRDAELHAVFVGFVFSMIFGHAPVIFPAVLGVAIPFRRLFYVHLALLHVGVALRVSGDLGGDAAIARDGALLNAIAIGVFFVLTAGSALARSKRHTLSKRAARVPTRVDSARPCD